ncbi:UDP-N-acetylmuramoyl-tripeptide--D-alanyl-D-alanine ligase [Rubritalea tangerina]|uniref:UDP-N-acetylmuramoyl-tripeptide--D-alanyl-D-alanine ligase n=1 Tax=Rubritalea tangerina TaxID=430798 RepID=A0ABW4ZC49_9BACT
MKTTPIQQLVNAVHGRLHSGESAGVVTSVSTDTRTIGESSAFFALRGENFDAHNFIEKAAEAGASAIVVEHVPAGVNLGNSSVIVVKDTLNALQAFAAWYIRSLEIEVVAITGSNGKTSTKDFTKAVLGERFKVHATIGNLNNHIGVPLTVLATEEDDEVCVVEMGMNHSGEIAPLCQIAKPRIGIITNVGTAHIEYLGSRQAIADEKGALARALPADGVLIVSAACDYADYYRDHTQARTMIVGNGRGAVRAEELRMDHTGSEFLLVIDGQESQKVKLPVVGRHMVANSLLAAGAGHTLGMKIEEIAAGLNRASLTSGRLRSFESAGVTVFDDTYNANPESMKAAIETLSEVKVACSAQRYVVLGKMAELGKHADSASKEIGSLAAERGLGVMTLGDEARAISAAAAESGAQAVHFESIEDAAEWLQTTCVSGDAVLFKGSRAAAMERVMHKAFPTD